MGQGRLTIPGKCYYEGDFEFIDGKFKIVGKAVNEDGTEKVGIFDGSRNIQEPFQMLRE